MIFDSYCAQCGFSHRKPDRLRRLKRTLPADAQTIREAWTCTYGSGEDKTKNRMLFRDLKDSGAKTRYKQREWYLQEEEPKEGNKG